MRITVTELEELLARLNGRRYSAYKRLRNKIIDYNIAKATLTKIQSDPHSLPSIIEVTIPYSSHRIPLEFFKGGRIVPFTDYIARILYTTVKKYCKKCGSGYSCYMGIPKPSPRILRRSCVEVYGENLVLRFFIGLPAKGRRILGEKAKILLIDNIIKVVKSIIALRNRINDIRKHVENYMDQEFLRKWLYENNYMFFIGDGSILPRESSLSERPLRKAIPFKSPETLRVQVKLPSGRVVTGMAVPHGLLMITGGGYHGKTTLLQAIQEGIYNHVEGDGRELVVSRKYTVLVRAEGGRIVTHVDVSNLIEKLPSSEDTLDFTSLNSSGSTSMAASIIEAIEAGAEVLLMDEDTSATNLLYKDEIMSKIIPNDPIKPLHYQVREIIGRTNTGIVIVASASSAFINVANNVVLMENYVPKDITSNVKKYGTGELKRTEFSFPRRRVFHGIKGLKKIRARGFKIVAEYDNGVKHELDLTYYPRIVEKGQVNLIAYIIRKLSKVKEPIMVRELVDCVNKMLEEDFFKIVKPTPPDLTMVDGFDVVWVLNRMYSAVFYQI